MTTFDFITDEAFRAALESDRKEMLVCKESGAWKAVHVLAGSIIEAVLVDYLIAEGQVDREAALKMDLGSAIALAKKQEIISERSAALTTVVKDYRNLIHPGRSIRSNISIDHNSAAVASSLLEMIIGEIERRKRANYGYTAEQILAKVERDQSARTILPHLLKDVRPIEIERLLIKILPDRYLFHYVFEDPDSPRHVPSSLIALFRTAFNMAPDEVKGAVSKRFVVILKEEADTVVFAYGAAFFRLADLRYVSSSDIPLIKEHYFGRLKDDVNEDLVAALEGIGAYLKKDDIPRFVDPLVRVISTNNSERLKTHVRDRLVHEYFRMDGKELIERLDHWIKNFRLHEHHDQAATLEDLKSHIDIPF
jgi:hypothetical protein